MYLTRRSHLHLFMLGIFTHTTAFHILISVRLILVRPILETLFTLTSFTSTTCLTLQFISKSGHIIYTKKINLSAAASVTLTGVFCVTLRLASLALAASLPPSSARYRACICANATRSFVSFYLCHYIIPQYFFSQ